mgnify:CR=1 FL=1
MVQSPSFVVLKERVGHYLPFTTRWFVTEMMCPQRRGDQVGFLVGVDLNIAGNNPH